MRSDTFFVGSLKGLGKVYLHAVIDTYGSYASGGRGEGAEHLGRD